MSLQSSITTGRKQRQTTAVVPSGNEETNQEPINVPYDSISHIRRLPEELLRLVFVEYVESGDSPWHLTLVCHKWHNVALSCHHLWSYIYIGKTLGWEKKWNIPGIARPVRSTARCQLCAVREDLKDAIERSGRAELAVTITILEFGEYVFELMEELLAPGVADRIWHLRILIFSPTIEKEREIDLHASTKLSKFFTNAPLTHLRSIDLGPLSDEYTNQAILNNIIKHATEVQLACMDVSTVYELVPTVPDSFWRPLKQLQNYGRYSEESASLVHVIPLCQNLETLQVSWLHDEVPILTFSTLISLNITIYSPHFSNLSLPRLEILQITVDHPQSAGEPWVAREANYPALEWLEVTCPDIDWMSKFNMPILKSLTVATDSESAGKYIKQTLGCFFERSFPSIVELTIYSGCREDKFISVLDAVPNVEYLAFDLTRPSTKKFESMLWEQLSRMRDGGLNLKELKEVKLGTRYHHIDEVDAKEVKGMLDIRAESGYPLKKLDILAKWTNGRDYFLKCIE